MDIYVYIHIYIFNLYYYVYNHILQVYVDIDPKLILVKCNKKIFTSVIVNSLVKAMKNIWIRLRSNENLKSFIQEISIIITPLNGVTIERFFDIRLMNIEVFLCMFIYLHILV
jgi:hypothetical protein